MTHTPPPRLAGSFRRFHAELAGALVLAALALLFLREPILRYGSVTFTTADITQYQSLTQLESGYVVENQLVTDPITQFVPWLMFNESELAHGRVPLWNPYNGCGAPHFANFQSAVFSPFSLLFYATSLKFALLASAFLKLFLAGLGTFLFLRCIALAWLPALFGGVLFMFSGHHALLVSYPHTAVFAFAPFALLAAEHLLQSFERDQREQRRTHRTGTWLAFVALLVAAIYSGHPEALCYSIALIAVWIAARLCAWWWRAGRSSTASAQVLGLGARFVVAALLGAGLGAPQFLPFFEYLEHSATLAQRVAAGPTPLDVASWPRYFFPDLLGSPGGQDAFAPALPPPNYEAATLGYVGSLTLLLAFVALPRALRDVRFAPFAALAIAWVLWAHDVLGASRVVNAIPLLRHLPIPVSQGPWAFALACCAAFQLDHWLTAPARRAWLASALVALFGLLALWLFHDSAAKFVGRAVERYHPTRAAIAGSEEHRLFIASTFLLGLAACAALPLLASARARIAAAIVVVATAWMQTGWLLSFHNTSCLDRYVFPVTPQLERVRKLVGDDRALLVGEGGLLACSNVAYELDQPAIYDGLGIAPLDRLYLQLFHGDDGWRQARRANKSGLRLFGIEWLLLRMSVAEAEAALAAWASDSSGFGASLKLRDRAGDFAVFEYTAALGRAWLVEVARTAATSEQSFEIVSAKGFDAGREVVLGPDLPAGLVVRSDRSVGDDGNEAELDRVVEVLERSPTRVRLRVAHGPPAYLVLASPWYPGWRATVDGRAAQLARANYAFTALDLPAGEHAIELSYAPTSWTRGLWIGAASLAVATCLALLALVRARRSAASTASGARA